MEKKQIDLATTVRDVANNMAEAQDAYLRDFFGSFENAEVFGKKLVIEAHPMKITTSTDDVDGSVRIMARQVFYLRMVTDEERAAKEEPNVNG